MLPDTTHGGEIVSPDGEKRPKLSVLIIAYNHEKFIAHAIDSVLMQVTDFSLEIVIGEDCSTDRTRGILLWYKSKYPEIIRLLFREKNIGPMPNFLDTLKSCRGTYIAVLEGDDYWTSPDKLQKQYELMENHPECSVCFHPVERVDENGRSLSIVMDYQGEKQTYTATDYLLFGFPFSHLGSIVFRADNVKELPDWLTTVVHGDIPLLLLLAEQGIVRRVGEKMGVHRVHSGGVTNLINLDLMTRDRIKIWKLINSHFNYKYDSLIRDLLSRDYLGLSGLLLRKGQWMSSLKYFFNSIITSPRNRHVNWKHILANRLRPGK